MADVYYHLKPAAEEARRAERREVMDLRIIGFPDPLSPLGWRWLDSETVRRRLVQIDRKYYRSEYLEVSDPDSNVGVRCPGCTKLHIMARSVQTFRCPCTPHEVRSALIGRETLGVSAQQA